MRQPAKEPCNKPLGTRSVPVMSGSAIVGWREEPDFCGRPARVVGADGVKRCVAHDRMYRGLPGGGRQGWKEPVSG